MPIGRPLSLTPNIARKVVTSTASGVTTNFTVTGGYRVGQLGVYLNGVRLIDATDYTARDGSTVGLTSAASNGDVISFQIFDSFNISDAIMANASDQTINGNLTVSDKLTVSGIGSFTDVVSSGIVTADSFYGDGSNLTGVVAASGGAIGVQSEGTYIGSGATTIDFSSSTGTAWSLSAPSAGVATATVTPGASLGMVIALGG